MLKCIEEIKANFHSETAHSAFSDFRAPAAPNECAGDSKLDAAGKNGEHERENGSRGMR